MKLRPLDPTHRLSVDLLGFARRLGILKALDPGPAAPRSPTLLIVGDGCPDNRSLLVVAHALNGEGRKVIDLVFPKVKREGIYDHLHEYVELGYRRLVLVIDQEEDRIDDLLESLKRRIIGRVLDAKVEDRTITAPTNLGQYGEAELMIIVNGLNDARFTKHTIEDHLLKAAEVLGLLTIKEPVNPKEEWNKLPKETQLRIFKELVARKSMVKELFKQHIHTLKKAAEQPPHNS